ncbi:periplasmic heavy metal sensor [Fibrella aquatica]|uniref:periplasmic heavy metal sensor n=1 Tax=Fibrella aquatica TaxID=3242487 RepID=UPI003520F1E4
MERTKLLTIAVIGLLLLNLITIGFLVFRPGILRRDGLGDSRPGEGPSRIIIERLQFDAGQQEQYRHLIRAHQQQTRVLTQQSILLHQAYYSLLDAEKPDSEQATSLSRQIGQNQQAQAQLNFSHFDDIKALCRPEQQANFRKLVSELSQLFGKQQRPHHPPHDGPPEGPPNHDLGNVPKNLPAHP